MKQELKEIQIEKIVANSSQPREEFDKEEIKELSKSIVSNGLINPIQVRVLKDGNYMIISGERRFRAHKLAGIKTIPAFVKEYDNDDWMVEGFIDNIQRTDLSSVEKAKYMKKLMDVKKLDVKGLSNILKISEKAINAQLILIEDKEIMDYVANEELASAAAQSILAMPNRVVAKQLAKRVIKLYSLILINLQTSSFLSGVFASNVSSKNFNLLI
jgi:ParB family chromosome partitioning protein